MNNPGQTPPRQGTSLCRLNPKEYAELFIGPVFTREVVIAPRRGRLYVYRSVYVGAFFLLTCTAWLALAGTQVIRNVGDMARFGGILFQILAPLQLALVLFFSAIFSASAVAQEKDRRTLVLLLMSRLTNSELVLGKLLASLLYVLVMVLAALPVFMLAVLLGGVSFLQVAHVYCVTLATVLVAGSLGSTIALWREKTFQTLALTALALVFVLGFWEAVYAGALGTEVLGVSTQTVATGLSPLRAVLHAARPSAGDRVFQSGTLGPVGLYLSASIALTVALNLVSILMVRVWNPSREVRRPKRDAKGERKAIRPAEAGLAEAARAEHVDARTRARPGATRKARNVWDNPILWREVCTWAYGRKVLVIRAAYLVLVAAVASGLHWGIATDTVFQRGIGAASVVPLAARLLAPLFLVSLVIVNALAVNSITNERDGQALDLLLTTDLAPKEFVFGKLGGVFWVAKEMIVLPVLLCVYLCWASGATPRSVENLAYVTGGLLVLNVFVAMLGVHCGMMYANSRTAIGVSLGTVFFLFLGIVTCILMMIFFAGSFQRQLMAFSAMIVGGGIALYVALGSRNPSAAIGTASGLVPFATFYAITSFMLGHSLVVFLVVAATYGFATAAMMVPAVYEFDVAMGRTTDGEK